MCTFGHSGWLVSAKQDSQYGIERFLHFLTTAGMHNISIIAQFLENSLIQNAQIHEGQEDQARKTNISINCKVWKLNAAQVLDIMISKIQGLKITGNICIFGFLMGPKTPIILSYAVFA